MSYIGGDLIEITVQHPTLGSYRFAPPANESFTADKGGFRSNDESSSVTAGGANIVILSNNRWGFDGTIAVDQASGYEENAMNDMAADPQDAIWVFSHASGAIKKGTGRPVGEINVDTNKSTMKVKIGGGGVLENIN